MAYLIEIILGCDTLGCKSRAVVTLKDWRNEERGRYCRKCGKAQLAKRQKFEDENPSLRK